MENKDQLDLIEQLFEWLTEIRIFINGEPTPIHHYKAFSVPQIGDSIAVQYWNCEVIDIQWFILDNIAHADVIIEKPDEF